MLPTRIIPPAANAHQYPLLIKRLLLSGGRYEKTREIVYRDRVRYSYATFNERVARLANVLSNAGVKAGDTVAVMDWDSHRYLECMFAIPMLGAVLHTINIRLSPEQILYTMNHAEDKFVLVNCEFVPLYNGIASQLTTVEKTLLLTDTDATEAELPGLVGEYEHLLAAAAPTYDFADFDENSVATTFYTTGTTGNPKGVYFTHRQLVLHTLSMASTLGSLDSIRLMGTDDVYMPITPMFHVHAWGVPYVATALGIKQVYPGRYEPNRLVRLYREEGVTFSHCVPTVLQMMLDSQEGQHTDLSGWKMLLGGSALTLGLAQRASERGISVHCGYGMSESCPLLSITCLSAELLALPMAQQLPLRIDAGVPIALVDLRIVDAEGREVLHDGESLGEIVVRAPWLTQGYLHEPEQGAALWQGGWMHTGDLACIDPTGVVRIRDRIKDVIKTGGEWVSSVELENLISQHPSVASVAVIGIPDPQWGEQPLALVVCCDGARLDQAALARHLQPFVDSGHLNKWAIPRQLRCVDEIPRTSVGKIDKKRIRQAQR